MFHHYFTPWRISANPAFPAGAAAKGTGPRLDIVIAFRRETAYIALSDLLQFS
jgi:hypothetical protein